MDKRSASVVTKTAWTYLVCGHKVSQILFCQHKLRAQTFNIRRRRFRSDNVLQGVTLGEVYFDEPRSDHHPLGQLLSRPSARSQDGRAHTNILVEPGQTFRQVHPQPILFIRINESQRNEFKAPGTFGVRFGGLEEPPRVEECISLSGFDDVGLFRGLGRASATFHAKDTDGLPLRASALPQSPPVLISHAKHRGPLHSAPLHTAPASYAPSTYD